MHRYAYVHTMYVPENWVKNPQAHYTAPCIYCRETPRRAQAGDEQKSIVHVCVHSTGVGPICLVSAPSLGFRTVKSLWGIRNSWQVGGQIPKQNSKSAGFADAQIW